MIDFKGYSDDHLPLIEFSYNNSYQANIGKSPFEALYYRKCRSPIRFFEVGEFFCPKIVYEVLKKVLLIREML